MNLKLKYLFALPIGDFNRGKEKQSEAAMKELAQRIYGRCRHIASGPMEDSITLLASASPSAHPTIECFKSVFGSKTKIVVNELYWTGPGMMSTPSAVHRDLSRRFGIVVMITHPDVQGKQHTVFRTFLQRRRGFVHRHREQDLQCSQYQSSRAGIVILYNAQAAHLLGRLFLCPFE